MDPKLAIKRLLHGIESYNPEHRSILEQHLNWQVSNGEYDFEANLALLRLYQFYPEHFNVDAAKLVLLKALASLNPTDLTLCKYLIQLDHLAERPLSLVLELGTLLETCRFPEFWMKLKENPNLVSGVLGFRDCMLKFILQIISQTYQRIPKSLLVSFLDMSEADVKKLIAKQGWSLSDAKDDAGDPLILVNKHEESVKSVKIQEKVNFDSITSMAGAFRPSKGDFFIKTGLQS
ncbi:unnamed protein product [Calicophoron daubneyi]|uniref:Eukaryotic translation initiation factor 3 subunit K n=1 Tax=Calicophoron daubneyi TaxID=300641 RepID=A0AAV2TFZ8_CALDB